MLWLQGRAPASGKDVSHKSDRGLCEFDVEQEAAG